MYTSIMIWQNASFARERFHFQRANIHIILGFLDVIFAVSTFFIEFHGVSEFTCSIGSITWQGYKHYFLTSLSCFLSSSGFNSLTTANFLALFRVFLGFYNLLVSCFFNNFCNLFAFITAIHSKNDVVHFISEVCNDLFYHFGNTIRGVCISRTYKACNSS